MNSDILKIKCPCCGAMVAVKQQQGLEKKKVVCPVCGEASPYSRYTIIKPMASNGGAKAEEDPTIFESFRAEDVTRKNSNTVGQLIDQNRTKYSLKFGKNVVGRKASNSIANVQIETSVMRMSREHLIIDVRNVPSKGIVHSVSLYKEKCNETFVNNVRLEYGDGIILQSGDVINIADMSLHFEKPDEEGTLF